MEENRELDWAAMYFLRATNETSILAAGEMLALDNALRAIAGTSFDELRAVST